MTDKQVQTLLVMALEEYIDEAWNTSGEVDELLELISQVRIGTFEDAGVMTSDKGFVLNFPNDSEFQVSIVRSR